ncbi:hypothetical protein QAD02_001204 [Eretmocerus hayati]|uniref:Uncharacterized protein n=1 Tax=Eretmocerus hayati TaxID=131215 RepID=A0ACC2NK59_9HYME|nr:hypothetical protein QAD02_001204 [Eretmocerus hayati]
MIIARLKELLENMKVAIDSIIGRRSEASTSNNAIIDSECIPDSLTDEEKNILRGQVELNIRCRQLREEMNRCWSRPREPEVARCRSLLIQSLQREFAPRLPQPDTNTETAEQMRTRLRLELSRLREQLDYLEGSIQDFELLNGGNTYEAGPCNDREEDDPPYPSGVSQRLLFAMQEGIYQNECNLRREVTQEIDCVNQRLNRINLDGSRGPAYDTSRDSESSI